MGRFVKRPVAIEAFQWAGGPAAATPIINWVLAGGGTARWHEERDELRDPNTDELVLEAEPEHLAIDTLEGTMWALPGDWIIRGVENEFYPCKPAIFDKSYTPFEESPLPARGYHLSDCATNNEPAMPAGPCDCAERSVILR